MLKKAVFMEGSVPKGGTCTSSFLVLKAKGGILVGKMARPEIWVERFFMGEKFAPQYAASNKWLIPASLWYEASLTIAASWLKLTALKRRNLARMSPLGASLCFVFQEVLQQIFLGIGKSKLHDMRRRAMSPVPFHLYKKLEAKLTL